LGLVRFLKNSRIVRDIETMNKKIQVLFVLIAGCTTTKPPVDERYELARYKVGDCLMLIDPSHEGF